MQTKLPPDRSQTTDPPILLAMLIAARRTGDRMLETTARRELEERHHIKINFLRPATIEQAVAHA